jgi:uncharacterized protein YggE
VRYFLIAVACCLAVSGQALAQTVGVGRIQVVGRGSVERTPDHAVVQVGAANQAATPTAALDENSAIAARIIAFAKNFGVDARDLKTAAVSLSPVTKSVREPNGAYRQEPDGYRANNTVQVRLRDISRLGAFMRDVLNQGANQIAGVHFGLADPDKAVDDALAAAVEDATRKANRLAEVAKAKLGRLQHVTYPPRTAVRPFESAAAPSGRALRMDVPIEAGALETSAEVEMIWALE